MEKRYKKPQADKETFLIRSILLFSEGTWK
jgi:hypothetical protein